MRIQTKIITLCPKTRLIIKKSKFLHIWSSAVPIGACGRKLNFRLVLLILNINFYFLDQNGWRSRSEIEIEVYRKTHEIVLIKMDIPPIMFIKYHIFSFRIINIWYCSVLLKLNSLGIVPQFQSPSYWFLKKFSMPFKLARK